MNEDRSDVKLLTTEYFLSLFLELFFLVCLCRLRLDERRLSNDVGGFSPDVLSMSNLMILSGLQVSDQSEVAIECRVSEAMRQRSWMDDHGGVPLEACMERMWSRLNHIRELMKSKLAHHTAVEENLSEHFPIEAFRQTYHLSEPELFFVIFAMLMHYESEMMAAWRFVTGTKTNAIPNVAFFLNILKTFGYSTRELRAVISKDGALQRYSLVRFVQVEPYRGETNCVLSGVVVPDFVASFLYGDLVSFVPDMCRELVQSPSMGTAFHADNREEQILHRLQEGNGRLAILGGARHTCMSSILRIAHKLDVPVLELDLERMRGRISVDDTASLVRRLSTLFASVRLLKAIVVIPCDKISAECEQWWESNADVFARWVEGEPDVLICVRLEKHTEMTGTMFAHYADYVYPLASGEDQHKFWCEALTPKLGEKLASVVATDMSRGYCLEFEDVCAVVNRTLTRFPTFAARRALTATYMMETLNRLQGHRFGGLATLRTTELRLSDLTLSPETRKAFSAIMRQARHRDAVNEDWPYAGSSSETLVALFSGKSGTGKSVSALVLGRELGRPVFGIDLSGISSKYIGETEGRLRIVFDEAERTQAILLFDEADALFAKRTAVKTANDRHANFEVNYLLQRIECFRGVVILTTNFKEALDDALARRINHKVDFPAPTAQERFELMQKMIPPSIGVASDVDWVGLAEDFELCGGDIRITIQRAAYVAAEQNSVITNDMLWDAFEDMFREMGHIVRDRDADD